ncbi:TFIIB-type zinc ribbon-containing protein [Segeticoccus rhizosphaerae]|jgi:Zn-finger nucleic acid-binding protein|uniref:TFIIB-type zinc ribbon-containing protein n=1 Tax=Segeticoccus rhizosphaerae TaxID=1104777 RepID=UPI001EE4718D|nr:MULTISPECIES: zf-TFIIB domain-containing protein [Intrasporangiaceae]
MTNQMTCPKCRGTMTSYERNGVHVDQCQDCRGLFLDRGELERLVDAEAAFNSPVAPAAPRDRPGYRESVGYGEGYRDDYRGDYRSRAQHGHQPRRKRRSFLEDLFD